MGVPGDSADKSRQSLRTWRTVVSIAIVAVITGAAAFDLDQPTWMLVGLIGPIALVWDEVARRHQRHAMR